MRKGLRYWVLQVMRAFRRRGGTVSRLDYISLLQGQLTEAIQHVDRGEDARYVNEMADIVSISYQAILAEHFDPESVTVRRIRDKILPKMVDGTITEKYRLRERKK